MASTAADGALSIKSVSPEELHRASTVIEEIYKEVFCGPPYYEPESSASAFVGRLQGQAGREGWRLLAAEQHGHMQGFVFGYISRPGQYWHDRVTPALKAGLVERWFQNSFVLVEFAVRPAAQGRGIGSRLHDAILDDTPQPMALTMTNQDENPAVRFYLNRGWHVLGEGFRFHDRDAPRLILGCEPRR
ncbi:MAG: GNAT family N-acetyltransferase [Trueperaceae bacterium]